MPTFLTIPQIIETARAKLLPPDWDVTAGGAETEATLRRNREALERLTFRPRVLRDISGRSTATTFLGIPLALPVMLAPVGPLAMYDGGGALTAARAAARAGTAKWVGYLAHPGLKAVAAESPAPLVYQVYVRGDRRWLEGVLRLVEEAGYRGICITVDSAVYGHRERDIMNRYRANWVRTEPRFFGAEEGDLRRLERLTWADIAWLREATRLPIIVKGIMTGQDARIAAEHGVDAVVLSNHGGRALDFTLAPIEVVEEAVAAVDGRAEVVVDSGFLRGTDVVKALCLGARAVLIGKLQCYALAAGGEEGLVRCLEILQEEVSIAMALLGARTVQELVPEMVVV